MPRLFLPALTVLTLSLAACGQTPPETSPASVQPALQSNLQFTLFVPTAEAVGPQYISAATTSLQIQVGDTDRTFSLSDGTPVNGGTRYRFAVQVAPGPQQVVKISTFNAQSKLLSQATQRLDLAPGGDNTFDLTLVGEAVTAGLTFDPNSNLTSGPSVLLDRGGTYTLGSALRDASGNTILAPGRPTDTVCSSDGTFTISGGTGAFTLTAPEPTDVAQNTVLTVHAGDCTTTPLGQIPVTVPAEQVAVTLASATPDVSSPLIATASLKTALGNVLPIAGRNITFTVTEQNAQVSTFSGVTDASGQLSTTAQSGLLTGTAGGTAGTVTASSGQVSGSKTYTTASTSACGTLVTLAPGQVQHFTSSEAAKLCLPGGTAAKQSYAVVPVNNTATSQTFSVTGTDITTSDVTANSLSLQPQGTGGLNPLVDSAEMNRTAQPTSVSPLSVNPLNALMNQPAERLTRSAGPIRPLAIQQGLPQGGTPAVGDLIDLNVAQGCTGTPDYRRAQVRAVTPHAVLYEEVTFNSATNTYSPVIANGLSSYDYEGVAKNFDIVFDTLTSQFGTPSDMDSSGRVAIFYTRAVNEWTPAGTAATTASYGQFNSRDLFAKSSTGCTLSNQGELVYMAVADVAGTVNGNVRSFSTTLGNAIQTLAGELTRTINASRRIYFTNAPSFEEPWLDQGLADEGRMLMFYRATAGQMYTSPTTTGPANAAWIQSPPAACAPLAPLGNIKLADLTTGPCASLRVAAFNAYANLSFTKFRGYLQHPEQFSIFTTGTTSPTQAFLQYSADRVTNAADQKAFWSNLIDSRLTGLSNVQNAIGSTDVKTWIRDWSVSLVLDDKAIVGGTADAKYLAPSWNYRSVQGALGGYVLQNRPLTNTTPLSLTYVPGGSAYMVLGVDAGKQATIAVTNASTALPGDVSVSVIRLK